MDFRALGESGVSVSRVGLGGFELGPQLGADTDIDRAVGVIETSVRAGVTWIDTAENYLDTRNESLLGAALGRGQCRGPHRDEGGAWGQAHRWGHRLSARSGPFGLPSEPESPRSRRHRHLLLALA